MVPPFLQLGKLATYFNIGNKNSTQTVHRLCRVTALVQGVPFVF